MKNGVVYGIEPISDQFEETYIRLRDAEKRYYDDSSCVRLPTVDSGHIHYKEWQIRKNSADFLINEIRDKEGGELILDVGCGNGWLTSYLYSNIGGKFIGLDRNVNELEQASRVFGKDDLGFIYGDVFRLPFAYQTFDSIVLAASVQYFQDFSKLIQKLLKFLKPLGAIYLVDSPFYNSEEDRCSAQKRTNSYYESNKAEVLVGHYHHHLWMELNEFNHEVVYDPRRLLNRVKRRFGSIRSPFPIIKIKK